MKIKRIILLAALFLMMFGISCYAALSTKTLTPLDTCESYSQGVDTALWTFQGEGNTASAVQTERGLSVKQICKSSKWSETIRNFGSPNAFSGSDTSLALGFSLKFEETPSLELSGQSWHSTKYKKIFTINNGSLGFKDNDGNVYTDSSYPIKKNTWYDFYIEYNYVNGYTILRVTDGKTSAVLKGFSEGDKGDIFRVKFFMNTANTLYIDNFWADAINYAIASDGMPESVSPEFSYVPVATTDKITVNLKNSIPENYTVSAALNGTNISDNDISVQSNSITVSLSEPLKYDSMHKLEIAVKDETGKIIYGDLFVYHTKPLCTIKDFTKSAESLTPGADFTVNAKISSENGITEAMLMLALYDKTTDRLCAMDFKVLPVVDSTERSFGAVTLTIPTQGSYKAKVYIWDSMMSMFSLYDTVIIE